MRLRFAALPGGVTWRMLAAVAVLGGIGFTMALFIAGLAFPAGEASSAALLDAAKVGVLTASGLAGTIGGVLLQRALRSAAVEVPAAEPGDGGALPSAAD